MPKARVSDIEMYYEVDGEGEDPVLITSGWTMIPTVRRMQHDTLLKHYKCIFHEHRNLGRSDAPDAPQTIEVMADDLAGLLDHLKIDRCPVEAAGGMGALVGLEFAIRHPDRVTGIHLGSPCLTLDNYVRELMQVWKALRHYDRKLWAREVTLWVFPPDTYQTSPEIPREAATRRGEEPTFPQPWSYDRIVDAYCAYNATDRASSVKCPVMITTGGERDMITGPRFANAVHKAIPQSEIHLFEKASHNYWIVYHEEWRKTLLDFFASLGKS